MKNAGLRTKDILAAAALAVLTQLAWNGGQDLWSASVHLLFYLQTEPGWGYAPPTAVDLDGDSYPDTLAHYSPVGGNEWKLHLYHLQSAKQRPFAPALLTESVISAPTDLHHDSSDETVTPLQMKTAHIITQAKNTPSQSRTAVDESEITERSMQFFCGKDWHDAASTCHQPCPSGTKKECADGEKCFADTGCSFEAWKKQDATAEEEAPVLRWKNATQKYTALQGGLPTIITLWSSGVVTVHTLAIHKKQLRMELSGVTVPLIPHGITHWYGYSLDYIDRADAGNAQGSILVTGTVEYRRPDNEDPNDDEYDSDVADVAMSIDAQTGDIVWRSFWNGEEEEDERRTKDMFPLLKRGTRSVARRRSLIPNLHAHQQHMTASESRVNCLSGSFRRPLLMSKALPHVFWSEEDTKSKALHFTLDQPEKKKSEDDRRRLTEAESKHRNRKHTNPKRHHQHHGPIHGKPNVLVTRSESGLQVRSLKNGRSLCHLGLNEGTLYADINHDGTLDSVQFAFGPHYAKAFDASNEDEDDDVRFIEQLAHQVATKNGKFPLAEQPGEDEVAGHKETPRQAMLHHVVALSGMPPKEQLFSYDLGPAMGKFKDTHVLSAPPLLVESISTSKGYDVVAALNTGTVQRVHGQYGRRLWKTAAKHRDVTSEHFPLWENPYNVVLDRINSPYLVPHMRPIVLVGDDGLALFSVEHGTMMASTKFPQPMSRRPVLTDFDGDGTTDILVQTENAIWGYQVEVYTGSSAFMRIMVGLVYALLLLAFLKSRLSPAKRRSDVTR